MDPGGIEPPTERPTVRNLPSGTAQRANLRIPKNDWIFGNMKFENPKIVWNFRGKFWNDSKDEEK